MYYRTGTWARKFTQLNVQIFDGGWDIDTCCSIGWT